MISAFLKSIINGTCTHPTFTELEDCHQQGEAAYSQAYRRDQNPYTKGTAQREWWDAGWLNDQDELLGT